MGAGGSAGCVVGRLGWLFWVLEAELWRTDCRVGLCVVLQQLVGSIRTICVYGGLKPSICAWNLKRPGCIRSSKSRLALEVPLV